jgi:hypothetical protein
MLRDGSIHRINDYGLLKFVKPSQVQQFYGVKDEIESSVPQYFVIDDIDNTVWTDGLFRHRLNKTYSTFRLFDPNTETPNELLRFYKTSFLLKQGFSWDGIFGLHLIIKSGKTGEVLISKIYKIEDFKIAEKKEIYNGSYWVEEVIFKIPEITDTLVCQVTEIRFSDISSEGGDIGYLYNFPTEFIPLIDEKPLPDYIKTNVTFDNAHYLSINLTTTENKTIEQSILDYFGLRLADINISHIINYGNDDIGYKALRISNEINKFSTINIGLNLSEFFATINQEVLIFVSTEILVDTKLMKREIQLSTNLETINPIIANNFVNPETVFPVEVVNENIIQNTIIEAKETKKLIAIYQPVFVEFIREDLFIERKNISFENLINQAYLKINKTDKDDEQIILSKLTSDNKHYFDLSELKPVVKPSTYEIISTDNNIIIGKGKVLDKMV